MFANFSNPSSLFVIIKGLIYTGIIPCFISPNNNNVFKPTFAQYGINTTSRAELECVLVIICGELQSKQLLGGVGGVLRMCKILFREIGKAMAGGVNPLL